MTEKMPEIMLLAKGELSFVLRSLKNFLGEDGVSAMKLDIENSSYKEMQQFAPLIVSEAEVLLENNDARVYLYDRCIELDVHLVLIGEPEQLKSLMNITSQALVAEQILRPINAKQTVKTLESLLERVKRRGFRKKILIVDDSPTFLRTASGWLEDEYNVSICPSATAAFHMIEVSKPDLILLDYEMPVCSGAQFLEMLHSEESTAHIPVIFLTSRSDTDTVKEVVALKPQGYLLKTQPKEIILNGIKEFFVKEMIK